MRTPLESVSAWLPALLFTIGFALRLKILLDDRTLWGDEAMLALNLVERGFADLLEPLGWNQAAPVGYLLLARLSVVLFGSGEMALRSVAALAGLGLLPILYLFTRRIAGRPAALVALALAAVAPSLVYYSAEVKQYGLDATVAIGLVALSWQGCVHGWSRRRLVALGLAGFAAVWISHPAAFVLGGCGATLFVSEWWAGRRRVALGLALIGVAWLVGFAAHHALIADALMGNDYLTDYWDGAFLPFPPRSPDDVRVTLELAQGLFAQMGRSAFADPFAVGERTALLSLVVVLLGGVALWRTERRLVFLLALPVLAAAAASSAGRYPFQGRLLVFSLPLLIVLAGVGVATQLTSRRRLVGSVLLAGLLGWPLVAGAEIALNPTTREEVRPCMELLQTHARPGDTVYVYWGMVPSFTYYTEVRELLETDGLRVVLGDDWLSDGEARHKAVAGLAGGGRTWVFFAHVHEGPDGDERRAFLNELAVVGASLLSLRAPGAWLDLYYLDPALASRLTADAPGRRPG